MTCLDSDFLIEVLRGNPAAGRLLRRLERGEPLAVSAIAAYEVTDTIRPGARERALAALDSLDILPLDGSVAVAASRISTELRKAGRPVPMGDLLIAATCLLHDRPLVTRNTKHFGRIRGLRLVRW